MDENGIADAIERLETELRIHAAKLRQTAEELKNGMHPAHAANRLLKMAKEIDPEVQP